MHARGPAILAAAACMEWMWVRSTGGPMAPRELGATLFVWWLAMASAHRSPWVVPGVLGIVATLWSWPILAAYGDVLGVLSALMAGGLVVAARRWALLALWVVGIALALHDGISWTLWLLPTLALPMALHDRGWWVSPAFAVIALSSVPQSASDKPDILLVTVDALRADRLRIMPNANTLASRGGAFPRARANSSWTLPSMASLHQGRTPQDHRAGRNDRGFQPPDRVRTLAMNLKHAGYRTTALSGGNVFTGVEYGLLEGFEQVHHPWSGVATPFPRGRNPHGVPRPVFARRLPRRHAQSTPAMVDQAIRTLDDGTPAFVWLHLMDVHLPYDDAPCRPEILTEPGVRPKLLADPWWSTAEGMACFAAGYDQAVRATDRALAPLLDLDLSNTWIVLTSDHGESLGEAGLEHGHSLDPVVVDIPLVIAGPESFEASEIPVDLIDVHATISHIAGLPISGVGRVLTRPPLTERTIEPTGLLYP